MHLALKGHISLNMDEMAYLKVPNNIQGPNPNL